MHFSRSYKPSIILDLSSLYKNSCVGGLVPNAAMLEVGYTGQFSSLGQNTWHYNLKEERFISTHGFWGFSPWVASSRQKHHDGRTWQKKAAQLTAAGKQRAGKEPERWCSEQDVVLKFTSPPTQTHPEMFKCVFFLKSYSAGLLFSRMTVLRWWKIFFWDGGNFKRWNLVRGNR